MALPDRAHRTIRRYRRYGLAFAAGLVIGVTVPAQQLISADRVALSRLAEQTHFHGLAVGGSHPSQLYLATHHGIYVLDMDDGTAQRVSETRDDFMGLTRHPRVSSVLVASGHPAAGGNLGLVASDDGGRTWQRVGEGAYGAADFHQLAVSPVDPARMFGVYGVDLQASDDGGRTWRVVAPIPDRILDIAASSVDADRLFAASRGGLLVSSDGGESWRTVLEEPATSVEITPEGDILVFVVPARLMAANERDLDWTTVADDFTEAYLLHLAVDPNDAANLFAVALEPQTRAQAVIMSRDGGAEWTRVGPE